MEAHGKGQTAFRRYRFGLTVWSALVYKVLTLCKSTLEGTEMELHDSPDLPFLSDMRQQAERLLSENLMPFWARHAWDREYGGFLTRLDRRGVRLDDSEKVLMMQVRMIHSLSAAHRHGLRNRGYLDLASQGFEYLVRTFWDPCDGGFYFSVHRDGSPRSTRKNTDFHAYALTGLSEYYLGSNQPEALDRACRVFDLLMDKAADRDMGFIEDFDGNAWPALNAEQMGLGERTDIKTIDMHTNMLEGMVYLAGASGLQRHRDALGALLDLICRQGIHVGHGCTITAFDADWHPVGDAAGRMTTSYGLNVELAWLIWEAMDVLNIHAARYDRCALGLIDHALAYGFDRERGGIAANGPVTGSVLAATDLGEARLHKSWWAQAEFMNALCRAYSKTGRRDYFDALVKTFDWIYRFQVDHACGDWYQDTRWDTGEPLVTDKGREFKTAFHAGRALIQLCDALRQWLYRGKPADSDS